MDSFAEEAPGALYLQTDEDFGVYGGFLGSLRGRSSPSVSSVALAARTTGCPSTLERIGSTTELRHYRKEQ